MLCVHDEAVLGWATGTRKMEKFMGRLATLHTKDLEKRARMQPLLTDAIQPAAASVLLRKAWALVATFYK